MHTLTTTYWDLWDYAQSLLQFKRKPGSSVNFDKKAYRELQNLTDHELRDIGITRGDIHSICSGEDVKRDRYL